MKVILHRDIPRVGKKNEVKEVSEGYARNFLFPKKFAEPATVAKVAQVEESKKHKEAHTHIQHSLLEKNLDALSGARAELISEANEKGSLFQGIHKGDIAQAIHKTLHIEIDPEMITLPHPIKETGDHEITVEAKEISRSVSFVLEVKGK